ncbi:unnamed protein product [Effrenium voratum]|nr:unnamed protein product [Effrenium voratum]
MLPRFALTGRNGLADVAPAGSPEICGHGVACSQTSTRECVAALRTCPWQQVTELLPVDTPPVLYNSAIAALGKCQHWLRGCALLSLLAVWRVDGGIFGARNAACGALRTAWRRSGLLLAQAQSASYRCSLWAQSAAVRAWRQALAEVDHQQAQGLTLDEVALGSLVSSCGASWRWASHLAAAFLDEGLNVVTCNAAVSSCEKAAQWLQALVLLQLPRPDVITYNAGISACAKSGRYHEARRLLQAAAQAVRVDIVTYSAAITSCEQDSRWQEAAALIEEFRSRQVKGTVIAYNAGLASSVQKWQCGCQILHEMPRRNLRRDVVSYNTMLSGCERRPSIGGGPSHASQSVR